MRLTWLTVPDENTNPGLSACSCEACTRVMAVSGRVQLWLAWLRMALRALRPAESGSCSGSRLWLKT